MTDRTLDVWCFDEHAGALRDGASGLEFAYADTWRSAGRPPLSQSLPMDGSYTSAAVGAFFGGLLPEGAPRDLGPNLGVSADNDYGMLAASGETPPGRSACCAGRDSRARRERRRMAG